MEARPPIDALISAERSRRGGCVERCVRLRVCLCVCVRACARCLSCQVGRTESYACICVAAATASKSLLLLHVQCMTRRMLLCATYSCRQLLPGAGTVFTLPEYDFQHAICLNGDEIAGMPTPDAAGV